MTWFQDSTTHELHSVAKAIKHLLKVNVEIIRTFWGETEPPPEPGKIYLQAARSYIWEEFQVNIARAITHAASQRHGSESPHGIGVLRDLADPWVAHPYRPIALPILNTMVHTLFNALNREPLVTNFSGFNRSFNYYDEALLRAPVTRAAMEFNIPYAFGPVDIAKVRENVLALAALTPIPIWYLALIRIYLIILQNARVNCQHLCQVGRGTSGMNFWPAIANYQQWERPQRDASQGESFLRQVMSITTVNPSTTHAKRASVINMLVSYLSVYVTPQDNEKSQCGEGKGEGESDGAGKGKAPDLDKALRDQLEKDRQKVHTNTYYSGLADATGRTITVQQQLKNIIQQMLLSQLSAIAMAREAEVREAKSYVGNRMHSNWSHTVLTGQGFEKKGIFTEEELHLALYLDTSGSMEICGDDIGTCFQAIFDTFKDYPNTTITGGVFNDTFTETLSLNKVTVRGDTFCAGAAEHAMKQLSRYKTGRKVALFLTDGMFSDSGQTSEALRDAANHQIEARFFGLQPPERNRGVSSSQQPAFESSALRRFRYNTCVGSPEAIAETITKVFLGLL